MIYFKKPFDTVALERLIFKIEAWIRDVLTDWMFFSLVRGKKSTRFSVGSGVLQDTTLSRILFLVYINGLLECVSSKVKLFADDAKLYRNMKEKEEHNILRRDLDSYCSWNEEWLFQSIV